MNEAATMNKYFLTLAAGLACASFGTAAVAQPAPDQGPPPGYGGPPPDQMGGPPAPMAGAHAPHGAKARFDAANTTHDGKLTQAQADAAGWRAVSKHFGEIDRDNKGYVTMQDVHAWAQAKHAARAAAHASAPPTAPMQGPPPSQPQ
jgi:hypothetical protein